MIAYSYIRFSSAEQRRGDSYRRQLEASEKYAQEHGLTLDTSLKLHDLGLSAFDKANVTKGRLGAFLRAIEDGRVPKGSYLLVESLDRLSRAQVMDALSQFTAILNAGVIIVTLSDKLVYSKESVSENPMQLIISILIMVRAHEESLTSMGRNPSSHSAPLVVYTAKPTIYYQFTDLAYRRFGSTYRRSSKCLTTKTPSNRTNSRLAR